MRIGLVGDFDEIEFKLAGQVPGFGDRIDPRLGNVVTHEPDLGHRDLIVDPELVLIFFRTGLLGAVRLRSRRLGSVRCCDKAFLL